MKTTFGRILLFCTVILTGAALPAWSQKISDKDAAKLVAEGTAYVNEDKPADALNSFRKAAKAGCPEGAFAAGNLLLKESGGCSGRDRILKLSEGLRYLFVAATNRNATACVELSLAQQNGVGVPKNLIAAYAWMKTAVRFNPALKPELDRLVLLLDPGDIRQAQNLADAFGSGRWPEDFVSPVEEQDPRFRIQGINLGGRKPLVVLNSATFAVGDTEEVRAMNAPKEAANDHLSVKCLEIGDDYVLLSVIGEPSLKLLSTGLLSSR
ncbi:MAG TPA: hypothetical protein VK815_07475 [Candidatus Acidoferrales bacterium]|jgi:hypothetical protein|nr:hypothetical protein [Candidatus Acidoferrales bacterium]